MNCKNLNVLALNCGSSSLKYRLIEMPGEKEIINGEAERVGTKSQEKSCITHIVRGKKRLIHEDLRDHAAAFEKIMSLVKEDAKKDRKIRVDIFAHRYVHSGGYFSETTLVTNKVIKKLAETIDFAPIHNPVSFGLIKACKEKCPGIPQAVVFDTAFHRTIPEELSTYAIPMKFTKKYGIRKMGFHGISHKYVMQEASKYLGRDVTTQKIISCHLGTGGASVCAIDKGKSLNNSMGFTPLEGLIMNTRSGDIDLGIVLYIMFQKKCTTAEIENILNKKSGILGVFSDSSDLRDITDRIKASPKAMFTFDMYVRRVRKYLGFYGLLLKKADIVIFTDSIGVMNGLVREKVLRDMEFLGIRMDRKKNGQYDGGIKDISAKNSDTRILVVPTNEELMIARETFKGYRHDSDSRS